MNKEENAHQEDLCIQSKFLVDLLRTNLMQLDLPNKAYHERDLKKLKHKLNLYYWSL